MNHNERITSLETKLRVKASYLSNRSNGALSLEDIYQEIVVKLLGCNDKFFQQEDAYILRYAEFMGKHALSREFTKVNRETDIDSSPSCDGETLSEIIPDENCGVEDTIVRSEIWDVLQTALDKLSQNHRMIVEMILSGYEESEIADKLKISRSSVSQTKGRIAKALGNTFKANLTSYCAL